MIQFKMTVIWEYRHIVWFPVHSNHNLLTLYSVVTMHTIFFTTRHTMFYFQITAVLLSQSFNAMIWLLSTPRPITIWNTIHSFFLAIFSYNFSHKVRPWSNEYFLILTRIETSLSLLLSIPTMRDWTYLPKRHTHSVLIEHGHWNMRFICTSSTNIITYINERKTPFWSNSSILVQ